MQLGVQIADASACPLRSHGHYAQLACDVFVLQALGGSQKCLRLKKRVTQDVRIPMSTPDQSGDDVCPAQRAAIRGASA